MPTLSILAEFDDLRRCNDVLIDGTAEQGNKFFFYTIKNLLKNI